MAYQEPLGEFSEAPEMLLICCSVSRDIDVTSQFLCASKRFPAFNVFWCRMLPTILASACFMNLSIRVAHSCALERLKQTYSASDTVKSYRVPFRIRSGKQTKSQCLQHGLMLVDGVQLVHGVLDM
jgi:hypothetical protein